jgi:hypothetical protein
MGGGRAAPVDLLTAMLIFFIRQMDEVRRVSLPRI